MGKFASLAQAELTKNWPVEERAALAHFLEAKSFKNGDHIFDSKDEEIGLYIIESGLIKISFEHISTDLKAGESFGEFSLLQTNPKRVSAVAVRASDVWVLSSQQWSDLRRHTPVVALHLMESMCKKLSNLLAETQVPPKMILTTK